jgi:homopolymeric O-antigen transport system permease protein
MKTVTQSTSTRVPPSREVIEIRPRPRWVGFDLANLWRYRELLYFLVWRDLKVRYRQTFLGAAWAVIQPFVTMVVFTVIFGRLVGVSTDGIPYPLFAFSALVPWTYFSTGVTQASNSLVGSQNLLKKVYFPRLVIPVAAVLAGLADLAIAAVVLAGMIVVLGTSPGLTAIWIIPLVGLATLSALGVGIWLAALNVRYRDVRYVVPFLLQVWLFATPVAYPSSLIGEPWRYVYALNPMVGVVEGVRWALFGIPADPLPLIAIGTVVAVVALLTGVAYFRYVEGAFADVV